MENGTIAEQGTHKELLRAGGTYAKLWAHQSGGFIED
jgi:ATP-binding cassette subfamily B protein